MGRNTVQGSHYQGPILGSNRAGRGLFSDAPLGIVDKARSPFKIYDEHFTTDAADGDLALRGATVTAINTPTAATEVVTSETGFLLINPGSKADSGTEVQFDVVANGTAANDVAPWNLPPLITSTATLMDAREMFFYSRLALTSDSTAFDGHFIFGWFVKDTSLMTNTTGVPSVATGGGFGFHMSEDGILRRLGSEDAITANGTAVGNGKYDLDSVTAAADNWLTLGARARWVDASAATGQIDYYVNGALVATQVDSLPMDSTETFALTAGIHNGPANVVDLKMDNLIFGISRPGLSYPYDASSVIY
jgi:hypothetical protein